MRKIILFLSGKWKTSIAKMIGVNDIMLCAPGLRPSADILNWTEIPKEPRGYEQEISDWLVEAYSSTSPEAEVQCIQSFLNDCYSYTLRPVVALLLEIKKQIEENGIAEILVLSAKHHGRMPMVGFSTTESLRGSPHLLYAWMASLLPKVFPNIHFTNFYLKGDALCKERIRCLVVGSANSLFIILLIVKILWSSCYRKSTKPSTRCKNIVLLRTVHQLRFVQRFLKISPSLTVVIFPQASQGSFKTLAKLYDSLPKLTAECRITIKMLLRAIVQTRLVICELKRYSRQNFIRTLNVEGLELPIRISDIADEIILVSVTLFYKNLLSELLHILRPARLINFELVGRMAGLESLAARENNVQILSVQSALVSSTPHPIFPYSDKFYADSAMTAEMISHNGSRKLGEVIYEGPPYPTLAVRSPSAFTKISFFSQPYEHDITAVIITTLCQWASNNGAGVTLRLHPRDIVSPYERLLDEFHNVLYLENIKGLVTIIEQSDLCVTRTSSVAKEALAMGAPVLLCLWSLIDQSIKTDYIDRGQGLHYCAYSSQELTSLLSQPENLIGSARRLQEQMFQGKTISKLLSNLLREE